MLGFIKKDLLLVKNNYKTILISVIIFILFIPIAWGTLICSLMGKNTIGHRMVKKINGNNYKSINLK